MARPRSEYINKDDIDHLLGILFDEARRDPKFKVKIEKFLNK